MSSQSATMQPPTKPTPTSAPKRAVSKDVVMVLACVLVLLVVVLAAAIAAQYFCCGPNGSASVHVDISVQPDDGNWSLTVVATYSGLKLDNVTLTILGDQGAVTLMDRVPLSALSAANGTANGAIYQRVGNETEVLAGARILLSTARYPTGCLWELARTGHEVLCTGRLA